jgi:PAS domain-containing protein
MKDKKIKKYDEIKHLKEKIKELEKSEAQRKQAEEALKESNENFQQVVSNITTVVWKADIGKNGAFENTYTSPVVDELLELPAGTLQNDWDKYFKYIKPEYLERVNNAFREAIISPGKEIDCKYEVLKDNGQTAWFQSKGRCFEKNGKLDIFGSTTDITERKQAEEELKKKINELETFYRATLGREERVIELKQEVNELLEQLGKKKKYRDHGKSLKVE